MKRGRRRRQGERNEEMIGKEQEEVVGRGEGGGARGREEGGG